MSKGDPPKGKPTSTDSRREKEPPKPKRTLGYALIVLGGVSTFVFLSPIFPIGIEAFLIGGVFFAAGAWALAGRELRSSFHRWLRTPDSRPRVEIDPLLPVRILRLAREKGGSLTLSDVATALDIPLDQAEEGLRACVRSGNALEDFDIPRGYTLYHFPEFMPPEGRDGTA